MVVPAWAAVDARLRSQGLNPTPAAVRQLLRGEINRIAGAAGLRPYEVPRDLLVEDQPWTRENGLLTGVNKPARPQLRQKYGARLEALYTRLEERQQADLAALSLGGGQLPLAARVQKAAAGVLGVPDLDLGSGSFTDLGGDSLGALTLATLLEELCGVPVPVAAILNPGSPLQALVGWIEARQGDQSALPGFAAVHGRDAALIRAADLKLERLLGPADLDGAAAVAAGPLAPVRTVLLTGATASSATSSAWNGWSRWPRPAARWWPSSALRTTPPPWPACIPPTAPATRNWSGASRPWPPATWRCWLGDLTPPAWAWRPRSTSSSPGRRTSSSTPGPWSTTCSATNSCSRPMSRHRPADPPRPAQAPQAPRLYLHRGGPGRGPGTRQGVRTGRGRRPAHGLAAARRLCLRLRTSKWASEVLLKEACQRFAAPVRVFRCDMILPHRRYRGQANGPDLLSRLLASLIWTGLAPRSFYAGGLSAKAHYDGLPVDFIAAAMVSLSSAGGTGQATFQLSNAHWEDGISLDTLVHWVESAGYPLRLIEDYSAWFETFRTRLQALPAADRQRSSLPILELSGRRARPWNGSGSTPPSSACRCASASRAGKTRSRTWMRPICTSTWRTCGRWRS